MQLQINSLQHLPAHFQIMEVISCLSTLSLQHNIYNCSICEPHTHLREHSQQHRTHRLRVAHVKINTLENVVTSI